VIDFLYYINREEGRFFLKFIQLILSFRTFIEHIKEHPY